MIALGYGPRMTQRWFGTGEVVVPVVTVGAFADLHLTRAMGIDRAGNLWFATNADLFRFDGTALARFGFVEPFAVTAIAAGPEGVVHLATHEGLLVFASGVFTIHRTNGDHHPTSVATTPGGMTYLLTQDHGAKLHHAVVFDGHAFRELALGSELPPELKLTCLAIDHVGELVIGAAGAFALRDEGTWKVFRGLAPSSSFAPTVDAIAAQLGVVWFGTPEGVYEYRGRTFVLHRTERPVTCLCVDDDEVWIGMRAGGLARLRAGEGALFQPGGTLLAGEDVTDLVRGADGRIWVLSGGDVAFIREGEIERLPG